MFGKKIPVSIYEREKNIEGNAARRCSDFRRGLLHRGAWRMLKHRSERERESETETKRERARASERARAREKKSERNKGGGREGDGERESARKKA